MIGVLLGVILASLDTAIANTALPTIAGDLHSPAAASIWVINAYQLAVVATMLPSAALGDRIGPRRIMLGGMIAFTLASLACACVGTLPLLTGARLLQGMGAGAIMSVNIALIRKIYPPSRLGQGVGMNALVVGASFALGPTVASLVLSVANWPWLFGINVPLGLVALACAWPSLPGSEPAVHRFDVVAAALTATTMAALIFMLSTLAQRQPLAWSLAALGVMLIAGGLLLRRQAGHAAPMLPVDLLRRPLFALSTLTSISAFATQGLAFVSLPFYFEQVLHRDPVQTGFLLTAWPVVTTLASPIAGRLSDRHPPGLLGGIGLAVLCLGMVALALPAAPTVPHLVIWMMVCGAGFGMFQAPNLKAMMASAPPERSGGASGMIGVARLLGQTSGAALVALCFHLTGGVEGARWALAVGAVTAGGSAIASIARLWAR